MSQTLPASPLRRAALALRAATDIFLNRPDRAASLLGALFPAIRGTPPKRGTAELLEAYNTMPWLRATVGRIGDGVAATTWRLYGTRRRGAERFHRPQRIQRCYGYRERRKLMAGLRAKQTELVEIEEHPLLNLVGTVNPFHVGPSARKLEQTQFELTGESFQILERADGGLGAGLPIALWPIPSSWVTETPTMDLPRYLLRLPNTARMWEVPSTEMLWLLDPDPSNPYGRGSGTARALADELETDEFAAKHVKSFFYNRGRPDFLMYVKPGQGEDKVPTAELRRMQLDWQQQHQGFWRAYKPRFVNRDFEMHEFQQNFEHQQLTAIRQYERDTIIQVLGIPPEILGVIENSNRATIDAADYLFARWVLQPRLEVRRAFWQERLVAEFDERIILDYDSPVPEDRAFKLEVSKEHPYAFDIDTLRELADEPPLDDDRGTVHPVPLSISFVEDLRDLAAFPATDPEANGNGAGEDERSAGIDAAIAAIEGRDYEILSDGAGGVKLLPRLEKQVDDEAYLAVHRIADRLEPRARRAFLQAIRQLRDSIDFEVLQAAVATGNAETVLRALKLDELAGYLKVPAGLGAAIRAAVDAAGREAARDLSRQLAVEIAFDVNNPHAVSWIQRHTAELVTEVSEQSRQAIRAVVRDAFLEGGHPRVQARLIEQHIGLAEPQRRRAAAFRRARLEQGVAAETIERRMGAFTRALLRDRAVTIARTETINAANRGQQLLWEQAERQGNLRKEEWRQDWIVTPDDRLDAKICEPMPFLEANQDVPLGGFFTTGDGRQIRGPTAHPRCRCAVRLVRKV